MGIIDAGDVLIANDVSVNLRVIQITDGHTISNIATVNQIFGEPVIRVLS